MPSVRQMYLTELIHYNKTLHWIKHYTKPKFCREQHFCKCSVYVHVAAYVGSELNVHGRQQITEL